MKKLTATLLTILLLIPVAWAQERAINPFSAKLPVTELLLSQEVL